MEKDKTSKWFWIFSEALEIDGPCYFYISYVGATCDKWSLGHLRECIFGSSPIRRVRTIFPLASPENCHNLPVQLTLCQLVVQLALVAYMRLNMKCLNTNTSEPLDQCVCAVGRPVFSCNSNKKNYVFFQKGMSRIKSSHYYRTTGECRAESHGQAVL